MKGRTGKKMGGAVPAHIVAHLEGEHGAITHHRKRGGRVEEDKKHEGDGEKKHLDGMRGAKAKFRLDRPGRKRGGRVGCDSAPLSTAGKGDHAHSASDEMGVKK